MRAFWCLVNSSTLWTFYLGPVVFALGPIQFPPPLRLGGLFPFWLWDTLRTSSLVWELIWAVGFFASFHAEDAFNYSWRNRLTTSSNNNAFKLLIIAVILMSMVLIWYMTLSWEVKGDGLSQGSRFWSRLSFPPILFPLCFSPVSLHILE